MPSVAVSAIFNISNDSQFSFLWRLSRDCGNTTNTNLIQTKLILKEVKLKKRRQKLNKQVKELVRNRGAGGKQGARAPPNIFKIIKN